MSITIKQETAGSFFGVYIYINPLTHGVNYKVVYTETNLQLKASGLLKYLWLFRGHQA